MNSKKARALRKYTRQKLDEYLHDPEKYEALRKNWPEAFSSLYKAAKEAYKKIPNDAKGKK